MMPTQRTTLYDVYNGKSFASQYTEPHSYITRIDKNIWVVRYTTKARFCKNRQVTLTEVSDKLAHRYIQKGIWRPIPHPERKAG